MNASLAPRSGRVAALAMVLLCLTVPTAEAATDDVGYVGASYTGATHPPTADKPQSKLWYAHGNWWANMYAPASASWRIFRLDRSSHTWVDTGVAVDHRPQTLSDTLWNGTKLYIASQWVAEGSSTAGLPARLFRYSYNSGAKQFVLDAGFPTNINNQSSESLTIDQDSTGRIWATWTQVNGTDSTNAVYVNSSANGSVWGTPSVLPGDSARPAADDISAVVAFGSNKIGVMWSNQLDETMYWAWRNDAEPLGSWHVGDALRGTKLADDHINLKGLAADSAGRVFAAVKTSVDELSGAPATTPMVYLLVFKPGTGSWTASVVSRKSDCPTRPQLVLDRINGLVHVFATAPLTGCPFSGAAGGIFDKVASIDDPVFPTGRGTLVMHDSDSPNLNNVTTTKQSVASGSGIVVLASNNTTKRYWHAELSVPGTPQPVASFTASTTSGTAPLPVTFTDTSTDAPTSWAWDFGDGGTSTAQSPSHTFAAAGTYTVTLTATNVGGSDESSDTITVTEPVPPPPAATDAGTFRPLDPARILDTRTGNGAARQRVGARQTVQLQVSGRGGVPASGGSAVVLNVTAINPFGAGYVTVFPAGTGAPNASNLNFAPGQTIPNHVTVKLGTGGKVALFNGSSRPVDLAADVAGWYVGGTPTAAGTFVALSPVRLLDTRTGSAVAKKGTVSFQVGGRAGIPTVAGGAGAGVFNVTAVVPSAPGYVTAHPATDARPNASNLNFNARQTIPNAATVKLGTDGKVSLFNGSNGGVNLLADVAGWFRSGTASMPGALTPLSPARILDTRTGLGAGAAAVGPKGKVTLTVAGRGGVPAAPQVGAVVLNVTAVTPSAAGYLTVYPSGAARPNASNLNFVRGQSIANLVTVRVSSDGKVVLFNGSGGAVHLIADVAGSYRR